MPFSNLYGVKGNLDGVLAKSITQALKLINENRLVWSAGSNGSITIWKDDLGFLNANFCRYLQTLDHTTFTRKNRLKLWLKQWWPEMENRKELAPMFR